MHRLLKLRKIPFQNVPRASLSTFVNTYRFRNCVLCQHDNIIKATSSRGTSTDTSPLILVTGRKRRRKTNTYAEILEVNGPSTKEARACVKKLKAKDLRALALEPEIGLGELHKIKTRSKFASDNPADPSLTAIDAEDAETASALLEQSDFIEAELAAETRIDSCHSEELESALERAVDEGELVAAGGVGGGSLARKHEDRQQAGKEEALARMLASQLDMWVDVGNPNRALSIFNHHRNHHRKRAVVVRSTDAYDTLLEGFAARAHPQRVRELVRAMRADGLRPGVRAYAAALECAGRLAAAERGQGGQGARYVRRLVRHMERDGFSPDDVMNNMLWSGERRELVLSALRLARPGYTPAYRPPPMQYRCPLLDQLNTPEQLEPLPPEVSEVASPADRTPGPYTEQQAPQWIEEQLRIETDGYLEVQSIERGSEPDEQVKRYRRELQAVSVEWCREADKAFRRELDVLRGGTPHTGGRSLTLEPYLRCLPPEEFARVLVEEARRLAEGSETYSPGTAQLHRELGAAVQRRYRIDRMRRDGVLDKVKRVHGAYCAWMACRATDGTSTTHNHRQLWQWLEHGMREGADSAAGPRHAWPPAAVSAVGQLLYKIIMHDLKVDVNVLRNTASGKRKLLPAFYTIFRSQGRAVKEEVKPHPALWRLVRGAQRPMLRFAAHEVPMCCPPRPWLSVTGGGVGGYLAARTDVVRLPTHAVQQWRRMEAAPSDTLYPSLDSLSQLGAVPWQVNGPVLDVVLDVFRSGGSARLDVPVHPSSFDASNAPVNLSPVSPTKAERFQAFRLRLQLRRRRAEAYSLWCDALYRLSLAEHFRSRIFWLPHNMDFRGRVYPLPPHLNHLGSDLARSLLVFAVPRPLGERGLDWLLLHLANLTGLVKREPLHARLAFARRHLDDILDSADRPLDGRRWWADADEPWQALACCMEVAAALRHPAGPHRYPSRFPVHQDGSCNGLQHYAALGRDSAGAASVNLAPAEAPNDVYSAVAELVEQRRQHDAEAGVAAARALDGFVRRKVIKQTVMTTVYGVTRFGARLQIARQLRDLPDFPRESVWPASTYLTARTFDSLRTMFRSAREIQDWFTECARLIAAVNGRNVEWVTPLGLPVVQPYSRYRRTGDTGGGGSTNAGYGKELSSSGYAMDEYERPNVMKQKNAFPPNFIHSLDSSHMMLTGLWCERAGITFVSVHDCFWTHANTVADMNRVCREQFVRLHSQPILEQLSASLIDRFAVEDPVPTTSATCTATSIGDATATDLARRKLNRILASIPTRGDFPLHTVLDSVYFFS